MQRNEVKEARPRRAEAWRRPEVEGRLMGRLMGRPMGRPKGWLMGLFAFAVIVLTAVEPRPLEAQDPDANLFLAVEGPTWGADQPALEVTDRHCRDLAYAAGWGDGRWRAYLNGREEDGEGDEVARQRIGDGPFINYNGTVVAETVEELHSDSSGMSAETVTNAPGQGPVPEDFLVIPPGSELDAADFSRDGPFFCFKVG